ncbi:hypothetical protein H0194_04585 [Corynebacterium incognita]|uniref:Uncharacterized protein n=1 Tax=Corynebacterium incognita TaxID=2754725 RepID=A0A7G7CRP4_9CORY|nr:hypothetical protein [Corynebacterium incognita]QNE90260.1 hypothetical protein H0194_04585 [Corynebacterium incognita]
MQDTSQEQSQEQTQAGQEPTPTPNDIAPTQPEPTNQAEPVQAESVDQLPDWAQQEIRKAREEAAKYRTKAKSAAEEVQNKAQAERDQLIQQIGKQLGLVEDDTSDPEKLLTAAQEQAKAAAEERDKMAQQLASYRRDAAVRGVIGNVDGKVDADLLTAVLNSDNAYAALDVNADDFDAQVAQIVTQKLEAHPNLIQAIHKASGVDTSNTNRGNQAITMADLQKMTSKEIYEAQKAGKLNHLYTN